MGWFKALAVGGVLTIYGLIVVGAIVRATESGLGCPDWPLCHGKLIPPFEFHALVEYSHRTLASVVSIFVIALGALALYAFRRERFTLVLALSSVGLLLIQIAVGGVTVLTELSPTIVTVHMGTAAALLAMVTVVLTMTVPGPQDSEGTVDNNLNTLALLTAVAMYALMLLGGYVRATEATFVCGTWPLCNGEMFPGYELGIVQMIHRFAAAIVGMMVVFIFAKTWSQGQGQTLVRMLALALVVLFIAQVFAGALLMWANVSAFSRVLHVSLGMAAWGVIVALATATSPYIWARSRYEELPLSKLNQGLT